MKHPNKLPFNFSRVSSVLLKGTDILVMISWPLIILYLIHRDKLQLIGLLLLVYFLLRLILLSKTVRKNKRIVLLFSFFGILLSILSIVFKSYHILMYYPIAINLTLLLLFGYSLWHPPSIVEQIARIKEPQLSSFGQRYTCRVTQVWCAFFIINGSISLFTVLRENPELWAWWNGFISYIVMGMIFLVEWFIRKRMQKLDIHSQNKTSLNV